MPETTVMRRDVNLYRTHAWRATEAANGTMPMTVSTETPGTIISVHEGGPSQNVISASRIGFARARAAPSTAGAAAAAGAATAVAALSSPAASGAGASSSSISSSSRPRACSALRRSGRAATNGATSSAAAAAAGDALWAVARPPVGATKADCRAQATASVTVAQRMRRCVIVSGRAGLRSIRRDEVECLCCRGWRLPRGFAPFQSGVTVPPFVLFCCLGLGKDGRCLKQRR